MEMVELRADRVKFFSFGVEPAIDKDPKLTKADLKRKFQLRVNRKGKGRVEEV